MYKTSTLACEISLQSVVAVFVSCLFGKWDWREYLPHSIKRRIKWVSAWEALWTIAWYTVRIQQILTIIIIIVILLLVLFSDVSQSQIILNLQSTKSFRMFSHEELLSQFLCDLIPMNKRSSDLAVLWFLLKVDGKFQGEPDLMPVAFIHSTEKGISRWREIAIWFSVLHWNGSGTVLLFI